MTFAPVGIRCPDHASVGAPKHSAQRTVRQAQMTVTRSTAPVTIGLIAVNLLVYLVTVGQGGGINEPGGRLIFDGALIGAFVESGDWYRLVTAMFLHAGLIHIAFNMMVLWWLGRVVEESIGSGWYLLIFLVSGIAGSAGALLLSDPFAITVGASGGVFGLMGALLILEYIQTGSLAGQAMSLIVLNLIITFLIPNISVGGHVGGLAGGIAATSVFVWGKKQRLPLPVLVGLILLVAVAAFGVAYFRVSNYAV